MKSFHHLCKSTIEIFLLRGIHTNHVFLARAGRRMPAYTRHEPGTKFRDLLAQADRDEATGRNFEECQDEFEDESDFNEELDVMNIDAAYDEHEREKKINRRKLAQIITSKKFFSSRPQPQMLTYQERECIRYLHKQDPVQWNVKILSESFPATTETISKILRAKWKVKPERAKKLDLVVQKNWELLADGKLDADPKALEHFKKFINRREVLLEQIKSVDFYLPEVKNQPVWNNGELSSIIAGYEEKIKKLAKSEEEMPRHKLIGDGVSEETSKNKEELSPLELLHKNIERVAFRKNLEQKDSFIYGNMLNAYSKETTLDELEDKILSKAERKKKLGTIEEAMLDKKLGRENLSKYKDIDQSSSATAVRIHESLKQNLDRDDGEEITKEKHVEPSKRNLSVTKRESVNKNIKTDRKDSKRIKNYQNIESDGRYTQVKVSKATEKYPEEGEILQSNNTLHITDEVNLGKVLNKIYKVPEPKEDESEEMIKKKKVRIVNSEISEEESIKLNNQFYDREVNDIKNTSFWKDDRSSQEKALAETMKPNNDYLGYFSNSTNLSSAPVFNAPEYPERIKIPKSQRGSGLTFRVKDCYYDDNGQFLYRVPGMIK